MAGGNASWEFEHPPITVLTVPLDIEDKDLEDIPKDLPTKPTSPNDKPPKLLYPEDPEPGEIAETHNMVVDTEGPNVDSMVPSLENVHLCEHMRLLTTGRTEEEQLLNHIYSNLMGEIILYVDMASEEEA